MGYELLKDLTRVLTESGIRAGEEYPGGKRMEVLSPVAAVGLRELDTTQGEARFTVRILSPLMLGGWCCQVCAAKAAQALRRAGYRVTTEEMRFASDCCCVAMTAALPVVPENGTWKAGQRWQVYCGGAEQAGVLRFRAIRDQGRRMIGALYENEPTAVSPGSGGWEIELCQLVAREPEEPAEPFELVIRNGDIRCRYGGCCWNKAETEYTQGGQKLTRRGYALTREVETVG